MSDIQLIDLQDEDREQFIRDNQEAFYYGNNEKFGISNCNLNITEYPRFTFA